MRKFLGVSLPALALAAGLSLGGVAHAQFVDWASVLKPNATATVGGVAQEFTYTSGVGGVTSVSAPSTNLAASITQTLDASGAMASTELKDPNRSVTFIKANGDTLTPVFSAKLTYGLSSAWERKALVADPLVNGWKYQTFGVWVSGLGQSQGSAGAASVGAITAGTAVPQTGSASFAGLMAGIYNDAGGQDHLVSADMGLQVNFAAHGADFYTTNTKDNFGVAYSDLDITGTFVSLPNHPALFGSLITKRLKGTSSAQFYGAAAEEVGGVFTLTPTSGAGLERLAGAFGGKRGTPVTPTAPAFASWSSALKPNATVTVQGRGTYTSFLTGSTNIIPSAVKDATFTETLDANGAITALKIATADTGVYNFAISEGDSIGHLGSDPRFLKASEISVVPVPKTGVTNTTTTTNTAIAADPTQMGWDYQSFGAWTNVTLFSNGAANGVTSSVASVGSVTPGAAVPTYAPPATFKGSVTAAYANAESSALLTSDISLTANWIYNNATFSISTMKNAATGATMAGTAVNGWLAWTAGFNDLTGAAATADGRLMGQVSAKFYGPAAEEIGGIMALSSFNPASLERLVAAFGAKR